MADGLQSPTFSKVETPIEESSDSSNLDSLVNNLAHDYSRYLKVDISAQKSLVEDEFEDVLTRLDEFTSLVDMVRGDSSLCLTQSLPLIFEKFAELEKVSTQIDRLEEMIKVMKSNLDVMEERVNQAEEHLDSSSVKKLFNSLQKPLFSKKAAESKKIVKYDPPEIFKTEDFFPPSTSESEQKT